MRQSLRSKKFSNFSSVRFNSIDKLFKEKYKYYDFKLDSDKTIIRNINNSNIYGNYNIFINNLEYDPIKSYGNNTIYITTKQRTEIYSNTTNGFLDDNSIFIGFIPKEYTNCNLEFNSEKEVISIGNNFYNGNKAGYQSINLVAVSNIESGSNTISIGIAANFYNSNIHNNDTICIGKNIMGNISSNAINIGLSIGIYNNQYEIEEDTIAIGSNMVKFGHGKNSVAIGSYCCSNYQRENSIAVGTNTGKYGQEKGSIFIGNDCGPKENYIENYNSNSYIIGNKAGCFGFKKNCIQIGQSHIGIQKENTISINIDRAPVIDTDIYFPEDIIYIGVNTLGDTTTTGPNTLQFNTSGGNFVPMSHTLESPGFFVNTNIGSSNIGLPSSSNNCVFYDTENYELFLSTDSV